MPIDPFISTSPNHDNRVDMQHKLIDKFYDYLESDMANLSKNIESRLDSVKSEREQAISMIEGIIR